MNWLLLFCLLLLLFVVVVWLFLFCLFFGGGSMWKRNAWVLESFLDKKPRILGRGLFRKINLCFWGFVLAEKTSDLGGFVSSYEACFGKRIWI